MKPAFPLSRFGTVRYGSVRFGTVRFFFGTAQAPSNFFLSVCTILVSLSFILFCFISFLKLTCSRWTSSLPSCLWSLRIFPSPPGSRLTIFIAMQVQQSYNLRQPMVDFYLLTFPRFPLRRKEHKSYFGKNRTHDFRTTSRCAGYLLDHSGDELTMYWSNVTTVQYCAFHCGKSKKRSKSLRSPSCGTDV